jgi:AcrR family transcriptional regulator
MRQLGSGAVAIAQRTRSRQRPEEILRAACRALARRGFADTRIADIAAEAGTSTGTVHYHFDTKDDVLLAALNWSSDRLFARARDVVEGSGSERAKLAQLLELCIPHPGPLRDEYVLWIELWVRILHDARLLPGFERISERWRSFFFTVVRRGTDAGEFDPVAPPDEVADRLSAMVDGLGYETVVGYRWTSPERMRWLLLRFAAEQLRVPYAELERYAGELELPTEASADG